MLKFNLSIEGDNAEELAMFAAKISGASTPVALAAETTAEAAKPEAPVKPAPKAAPKAAMKAETAAETKTEAPAEQTKKQIAIEDVRALTQEKSKAKPGNRDKVLEMLAKYDTASVTAMDTKHYEAYMNDLNTL